jgi:hypothetical protein
MSPVCPKCGTVASNGPTRTFVVQTRYERHKVEVPEAWRVRADKSMANGEAFALTFEDEDGTEAARFNAVTMYFRDDAEVSQYGAPRETGKSFPEPIQKVKPHPSF